MSPVLLLIIKHGPFAGEQENENTREEEIIIKIKGQRLKGSRSYKRTKRTEEREKRKEKRGEKKSFRRD